YRFFKSIDYYMNKAKSVAMKNVAGSAENYCDTFLDDSLFTNITNIRVFCAQFKRMYDLLYSGRRDVSHSLSLDDVDRAFLNYWLNDKLRGTNIDKLISVNDFYKKLRTKNNNIFNDTSLEEKLYNIESYDLENMRILYDIYHIKSKISTEFAEETSIGENSSCLTYTKECYGKYRDAIIKCLGGCFDFYTALSNFRNKFEEDLSPFTEKSISCKYKELFLLPYYRTVLKEHESAKKYKEYNTFNFIASLIPFSQNILEKIKRTKNTLFHEDKRVNELLSYTSDDERNILNGGDYSISYYTVRNS
ncbi:PIR Superfamily Protein, partial [Plasmodium ovale curtisi]